MISPALVLLLSCIVFTSSAMAVSNDRARSASSSSRPPSLATLAIGQTLIILTAGVDLAVGTAMLLTHLVMAKIAVDQGVPGVRGPADRCRRSAWPSAPSKANSSRGSGYHRSSSPSARSTSSARWGSCTATPRRSPRKRSGGGLAPAVDRQEHLDRLDDDHDRRARRVGAVRRVRVHLLSNTAWGRHVYADGDDHEAARLAGINATRVLISVYIVAGLLYAIGGWVQLGRSLSASSNAATDINLETITAVVIGGTSLFGGRGRLWGTLVGALIVTVFRIGLSSPASTRSGRTSPSAR